LANDNFRACPGSCPNIFNLGIHNLSLRLLYIDFSIEYHDITQCDLNTSILETSHSITIYRTLSLRNNDCTTTGIRPSSQRHSIQQFLPNFPPQLQ
jgi:hypothetical protein